MYSVQCRCVYCVAASIDSEVRCITNKVGIRKHIACATYSLFDIDIRGAPLVDGCLWPPGLSPAAQVRAGTKLASCRDIYITPGRRAIRIQFPVLSSTDAHSRAELM